MAGPAGDRPGVVLDPSQRLAVVEVNALDVDKSGQDGFNSFFQAPQRRADDPAQLPVVHPDDERRDGLNKAGLDVRRGILEVGRNRDECGLDEGGVE